MLLLLWACASDPGDSAAADDTADTADTGDGGADSGTDTAGDDSGDTGVAARFPTLRLSPPALLDPSSPDWAPIVSAAAATEGLLFVDPSDGPGSAELDAWSAAVADAGYQAVPVLGYVATQGGARSTKDTERDIGRYFAWYDTEGVWFDTEGAADCATAASWYGERAAAADLRAPDGDARVATLTSLDCEALMAQSELLVLVQDGATFRARTGWSWAGTYGPDRFVAWITGVDAADLEATLAAAEAQGFGHVWVTDASGEQAFSRAPTHLDAAQVLLRGSPG